MGRSGSILQIWTLRKVKSSDYKGKLLEIVDRLSTAVQSSVEARIWKTYSDVAKSSLPSSPVIPKETIKTVAKKIAAKGEMCRNIMIFGLPEDENEKIDDKVTEIFEQLGEKPRTEARRLGKKQASTAFRPVKVS